jgi:hypothetical protein
MKASVFIAATLDGYIATPDGDIDFLNQHPSTNPDEYFGYHAFIDTIDGGQTIQGFFASGLIQELTLTRIPTLLGKGIPLFSDVPQAIQLMPIHTQQYDNGYVQTRYRVIDKSTL